MRPVHASPIRTAWLASPAAALLALVFAFVLGVVLAVLMIAPALHVQVATLAEDAPAGPATAGTRLACRLVADGGVVRRVAITNTGTEALPGGTALAWATLGDPAPRGQRRQLPVDLQPGTSIELGLPFAAHGAGCRAEVVG